MARGWEVGLQNNLKLAIVDEDSGTLQVAPALRDVHDAEFASRAADPTVTPGDGHEIDIQTGTRQGAPALVIVATIGLSIAAADLLPAARMVTDRGSARSTHAVLPMRLVLVGQDLDMARVWNPGVPVYRPVSAGTPVAVAFRIVLDGPNAATLPARRQAWLFAGGRLIGPLAVKGR